MALGAGIKLRAHVGIDYLGDAQPPRLFCVMWARSGPVSMRAERALPRDRLRHPTLAREGKAERKKGCLGGQETKASVS